MRWFAVEQGRRPQLKKCYPHRTLSAAADYDNFEVCLLLVSHAADVLEIVGYGQTALDLYGSHRRPNLTPEVKTQRRALLRKAYDEGPHPNAFSFFRQSITLSTLAGSAAGRLCVCWCATTSSRLQLARRTCS